MLSKLQLFITVAALLAIAIFPEFAGAQTEDGNTLFGTEVLPASRANEGLFENIIWVILLVALLFIVAVVFFGAGDLILGLFASLGESRRSGDWGPFLRTLGIVIAILVVVIFIATIFVNAITSGSISFNPSVQIS